MQFNQPDSIIPNPVNPQSWNRCSYVLNNPINAFDPNGHICVGEPDECLNEKDRLMALEDLPVVDKVTVETTLRSESRI